MHPYADLAGAMANAGLTHILGMEPGGQRYFQLADALGSTTALTTHSGTIAERTGYDSYGNLSTPITTGNPFAFTGVLHEPTTALYLMPLRAYDPALGRFLSEDPLPAVNWYPYALNGPAEFADPTGAAALAEYAHALTAGLIVVAEQRWMPCSGSVAGSAGGILFGVAFHSALPPLALARITSGILWGVRAGLATSIVMGTGDVTVGVLFGC